MKHYHYHLNGADIPKVAKYLASYMKRDLPSLEKNSSKYNQAFVDAFDSEITSIEQLIQPKSIKEDLKLITKRLYGNLKLVEPYIYSFEEDYKKIEAITGVSLEKMGFSAIIKRLHALDIEHSDRAIRELIKNLKEYSNVFSENGITFEVPNELENLLNQIEVDNDLQNDIYNEEILLLDKHKDKLNELWHQMQTIMEEGQDIMGKIDEEKANHYHLTQLKMKLTSELRGK